MIIHTVYGVTRDTKRIQKRTRNEENFKGVEERDGSHEQNLRHRACNFTGIFVN